MIKRQHCLARSLDLLDLSQMQWVRILQQQWDLCFEAHPAQVWHWFAVKYIFGCQEHTKVSRQNPRFPFQFHRHRIETRPARLNLLLPSNFFLQHLFNIQFGALLRCRTEPAASAAVAFCHLKWSLAKQTSSDLRQFYVWNHFRTFAMPLLGQIHLSSARQ